MPFDLGQRLVQLAAGVYVEQDTLHIVERILEYDPNLRVKYLDPDAGGELGDPPYKIYERCPDGYERLVFSVWTLDERVLERLYAADTQKNNVLLRLDGTNAAARNSLKRRFEEERESAVDIMEAILRSPRNSYTVPGNVEGTVVKFSSHEPVKTIVVKTGTEAPDVTE